MDLSAEYILMCEKAMEIQVLWQFKMGDWFTIPKYKEVDCLERDIKDDYFGDHFQTRDQQIRELQSDNPIYLPRQDQLQEMVSFKNIYSLINGFTEWYWAFNEAYPEILPERKYSMDQLWLRYVMENKYGKTWNGQEWVK